MRLLLGTLLPLVFVLPASPALGGTCSGAPRSTTTTQVGYQAMTTMAIQYDPSQWAGTDISSLVQAAIDAWHTECSGAGSDYPMLLNGGSGSYNIVLSRADRSPDDRCGSESPGSITIYNRTRSGVPCSNTTLIIAHEIGHSLGLGHTADSTCCQGFMMFPNTAGSLATRSVQTQECSEVKKEWIMPNEPEHPSNQDPIGSDPEPIPNPDCTEGRNCTPILIDVGGQGFRLTSVEDGVSFDMDADGARERISWTDPWGDEAFLALDRNGNGTIDDGAELFGGLTAQPPSDEPNGFHALAVFDAPPQGGNDDGWLSAEDAVFPWLLLWHDSNQDGVSQPFELTPLTASDVEAIGLDPVISRRADRYGNLFRWASRVRFTRRSGLSAVDVIFLSE